MNAFKKSLLIVTGMACLVFQARGQTTITYYTSPNVTSAPAIISFAFSGDGIVYNSNGSGYEPSSLSITDPNGAPVTSLNLTAVLNGTGSSNKSSVKAMGNGTSLTVMGLVSNTTSTSLTQTANSSLTASATTGESLGPIQAYASGPSYRSGEVDFSGTFSFYAPSNGVYTIAVTTPANTTEDAEPGEDGNGNQTGPVMGTILSESDLWVSDITFSPVSANQLPSGGLSATQTTGGAGGVTLNWWIKAPAN